MLKINKASNKFCEISLEEYLEQKGIR